LREYDEDRLRDFLGVMRITGETQRGGIDEVHISRDDGGNGSLGFVAGEFGEQFKVVQFRHLSNHVREPRNWTTYFVFSTTSNAMGSLLGTSSRNQGSALFFPAFRCAAKKTFNNARHSGSRTPPVISQR
jgi:hypothetical protein